MKKHISAALAALLLIAGITPAIAQTFPTVPSQTVIGRLGTPGTSGPSQAIPFATLGAQISPYISVIPTGATTARNLATWAADDPYIEDFGGGTGVANNTTAFNAAVAAGRGVRFRAGGSYNFTTAPNCISKAFRITGPPFSDQLAQLNRNYNEATATRGLFCWTTGEMNVANVFIVNNAANTGGAGLSYVCATQGGCLGHLFNVRISSSSDANSWQYSIYVDGSTSTSPIGVRTFYMNNVTIFGALTRAAYFKSVVHLTWLGGATNQAGGSDGGLELTGTAGAPSSENNLNLDYVNGNVILDRFSNSTISIGELGGNVTNTANTSGIVGRGIILGVSTVQNNWTNSSWDSGDRTYMSTGHALDWGAGDIRVTGGTGTLTFSGAAVGGYQFDTTISLTANRNGALGTSSRGFSSLFLGGSTSGLSELVAPAIAGTSVITLPAATSSLATLALAETLTNKTLGAVTLSGLVTGGGQTISGLGALNFSSFGSVSAPLMTLNDADTGIYSTGAGTIDFATNGFLAAIIVDSGATFQRDGNAVTFNFARKDAFGATGLLLQISSNGQNAAGTEINYARMWAEATDNTTGGHDGKWEFGTAIAGTTTRTIRLEGTVLSPVTTNTASLGSSTLAWTTYVGHAAQTIVTTVGSLGTCNAGANGTRRMVSDANATTFASTVAAGGANNVPVVCNGTNWIIGANDNFEPKVKAA
jgi:hypothetical protein